MMLPQSKAYDILNKRLTSVNVWANQPFQNSTYYKPRISSSSGSISDPDISQRSVSVGQSKLHCQELMDHFDKVVGADDLYEVNDISADNSQLPVLGTFLDSPETVNDISMSNTVQLSLNNNEGIDIPNDASSVIEHDLTKDTANTVPSRNTQ